MIKAAVKFCGGCNPRYDRGKAYEELCAALKGTVCFSHPTEGEHYTALVILRGCTGCPYLYEDISATHRFVSTCQQDIDTIISELCLLNKEEETKR